MREIKFRAFDKKDNEMFYSSMYQDKTSMAYGLGNFLRECGDIEDTLMQYTGFKDKNEVEIYEGDIIEYMTGQLKHIPTKHKVTWLKDEARFSFGCKANKQYMFYNTVVIGNIYENPELTEEVK